MSVNERTTAPGDADVIKSARARIAATRDHHIVITDLADRAYAQASNDGPLAGWTLAIKDNVDVVGVPTTHGSLLHGEEPALATAPVVAALEASGAMSVAKVNLHEFAYGVSSANRHFGAVRNPTHPEHTPGGSSGGSAAAVATGIARVALGTDTGGSVRIPAACTGIVGLRPRNGILDQSGVGPLAPSFDTVGPLGASVEDVAAVWEVLVRGAAAGMGGALVPRGTHFGADEPVADPLRPALAAGGTRTGARIGVVGRLDAGVLDRLGVQVESFVLDVDTIQQHFATGFRAEVSRTHAATFPALADSYDPNVAAKLAGTRGITTQRYVDAMGALTELRTHLLGTMDAGGLDALATPVLGGPLPRADADELLFRDQLTWYPAAFSALNLPALAIGDLQLVGRTEADVLALGRALETSGYTPEAASPE